MVREIKVEELEAIEWSQEKMSYWDEMLKRVEEQCRMERIILKDICGEIDPENSEINNSHIDMAEKNGTNIVILNFKGEKIKFDFSDITLAKIERNYPSEVSKDMVCNLIKEILNHQLNS